MALIRDIGATYRRPGRVVARLLGMGQREDRALVFLMGACLVVFIAQWPRLARQAHLEQIDLNVLLGSALLGWIFIAPLMFYALALIAYWIGRLLGAKLTPYRARVALFWAFLASTPVILLHGLVAGFIGPGAALQLVGLIWFCLFLWFWGSAMRQAGWGAHE